MTPEFHRYRISARPAWTCRCEYLKQHEPAIASYNVIKGFLNLTIASDVWVELLNRIHADAEWGIRKADENAPLVMIEYSSPNTNKPLHLGHVRNNLLGNALANIMAAKIVNLFCSSDRAFPQICSDLFHQLAALSLLFHIFIERSEKRFVIHLKSPNSML